MAKYEHKRQPVCVCERDKCLMCSEEKYTKICKTNKPELLKEIHGTAVSCKYTAGAQFSTFS